MTLVLYDFNRRFNAARLSEPSCPSTLGMQCLAIARRTTCTHDPMAGAGCFAARACAKTSSSARIDWYNEIAEASVVTHSGVQPKSLNRVQRDVLGICWQHVLGTSPVSVAMAHRTCKLVIRFPAVGAGMVKGAKYATLQLARLKQYRRATNGHASTRDLTTTVRTATAAFRSTLRNERSASSAAVGGNVPAVFVFVPNGAPSCSATWGVLGVPPLESSVDQLAQRFNGCRSDIVCNRHTLPSRPRRKNHAMQVGVLR